MLYFVKWILAFCSIAYELVLAQSLSAFLQNTVLRYSVTVGLYMCSMGFGALFAERRWVKRPLSALLRIEIALTALGGFSVVILYLIDWFHPGRLLFSLSAHLLIVVIGFLTGFELPLIIALSGPPRDRAADRVLAVDYWGALCGTLAFAFLFYPHWGLVPTAFSIGILNAASGALLWSQRGKAAPDEGGGLWAAFGLQFCLLIVLAVCLWQAGALNHFLIRHYLS